MLHFPLYLPPAYVKDTAFPALYDTTTILVNVMDINDNSPVFKDPQYNLQVPENSQYSVVHTVMASDADTGKNGMVTYNIQGKKGHIRYQRYLIMRKL